MAYTWTLSAGVLRIRRDGVVIVVQDFDPRGKPTDAITNANKDAVANYIISQIDAPPAPPPAAAIIRAVIDIDKVADEIRYKFIGDAARIKEYDTANQEATAFKAGGYAGDVPQSIKSWAEAKEWTNQAAADDILATAAAWNAVLYSIRDVRLKGKESVRSAVSMEDLETKLSSTIEALRVIERMAG